MPSAERQAIETIRRTLVELHSDVPYSAEPARKESLARQALAALDLLTAALDRAEREVVYFAGIVDNVSRTMPFEHPVRVRARAALASSGETG